MSIFCPFREEKRANSRNHNYMLNNPFHFCRILKIPYQALKLLQICGSTTCLPAVQLLLQMWLGWSMTLLLSACLVLKCKHNSLSKLLSSPRPKGERASRARAVTVSQCPHSEVGQDFLLRRRVTLTETAVTRKRKVEKWIRRCQNFRLREGYKRAIDEIRGPIAKNGFSGKNPKILAPKKNPTS